MVGGRFACVVFLFLVGFVSAVGVDFDCPATFCVAGGRG